jgi:hypothetical protein
MSQSIVPSSRSFTDGQVIYHLIRQEWRLCRGTVVALSMVWVIGLWVLVIFNHPGWLLAVGLLHLLMVAPTQAGRDVLEGTEEFSFTQPPGRGPLYLARLALGFGFLLVNGVLGGLAIAWNLPQRLWSLVFSGGLTEPFQAKPEFVWYGMALLVPMAAHGVTFALAANSGSRANVQLSWMGGALVAGLATWAGIWLESLLWPYRSGCLAFAALLSLTVLVPLAGYFAYNRKEAVGSSGRAEQSSGGIAWVVAAVGALLVFLLVSLFYFRTSAVRSMSEPPPPQPVPLLTPTPERNSN